MIAPPTQAEINDSDAPKARPRELGIPFGILSPGKHNAITDVAGVKVGHTTVNTRPDVNTGVTVILPHSENPFTHRVPAAVHVGNGFGKAVGFTQIEELGELETPIALTNTLGIHRVADALADYVLALPGNENVRSVNPVVGETNDGRLNHIREKNVNTDHLLQAIASASDGPVTEGNVGAGTGTVAYGFKGGIGTSSRKLPQHLGGYTVGVLVQTNFGGILSVAGIPIGEKLGVHYLAGDDLSAADGSLMIIVATDAPLDSRNLKRLASRSLYGMARTGGFASNGSGDYVIAFSTNQDSRINRNQKSKTDTTKPLRNDEITPLFLAVTEATEEAIINSLFLAKTTTGYKNRTIPALPIPETLDILRQHQIIK